MVQELHVLKCFACQTFQSQIVKKTNKWECKLCGFKQSIKKVYGRGSGKDCRLHTQKLNAFRREEEERCHNDDNSSENNFQTDKAIGKETSNQHSKWTEYVEEYKADRNSQTSSNSGYTRNTLLTMITSKKRKCSLLNSGVETKLKKFTAGGSRQNVRPNRRAGCIKTKCETSYTNEQNENDHMELQLTSNDDCLKGKSGADLKWKKYLEMPSKYIKPFCTETSNSNRFTFHDKKLAGKVDMKTSPSSSDNIAEDRQSERKHVPENIWEREQVGCNLYSLNPEKLPESDVKFLVLQTPVKNQEQIKPLPLKTLDFEQNTYFENCDFELGF